MKPRHKILYIIKGPWGCMGTTGSYMLPLTIQKIGYDIQVVAFNKPQSVQTVIKDLPTFLREFNVYDLLSRVRIIRETLRSFKPDIVHMFTIPLFAYYPFLCSIGHMHKSLWLIDIRSPPLRLKVLPAWLKPFKSVQSFLKQIGFSCVTSHVVSSAKTYFAYLYKPLHEVPFGVDMQHITLKGFASKSFQPATRFVYLGSIAKLRKLDILFHAIRVACKKLGPSHPFYVDFIGNGDALGNLQQLAAQFEIEDIVTFKGLMAQDCVFQILHKYDVGIGYVPYEQYMGAPTLKVVEYMAAGIGVIASDTDGVKIHVRDKQNGILFENSIDSIAATIIDLVRNGYPVTYSIEGLHTAQECSWENIVHKTLVPVYEKLLLDRSAK